MLSRVTPEMECFDHETFGPVVSIYRFSDESEAIERANEGEYGLNASVWTRDGRRGRAVAAQLVAGSVNVNEAYAATFGSIDTPMGGMRASGLGRRQGAEGIRRFVEPQAIATQRLLPIAASHGIKDEAYAELMTGAMRVLKKLGRRMSFDSRRRRHRLGLRRLVSALRLVEKGYRVAVLEAGARFDDGDFAKNSWDTKRFLFAPKLGCTASSGSAPSAT